MINLFLDTEFSSLDRASSRLISLALVSETSEQLYVEMPRHTWRFKASEFVIEVVEPLLWGGSYEATDAADFCQRTRGFLNKVGRCSIVTDAPLWDMEFLRLTLEVDKKGWPSTVLSQPLYYNPEGTAAFDDYWREPTRFRHHALHDALALRASWLAGDCHKKNRSSSIDGDADVS